MTQAYLRRARNDDLNALHEIWMQDHVLPFMSFELMSKNAFTPIFLSIMNESDVYVLEKDGKVIATRRMIFRANQYAHTVEFASFGVHKDYLKQGYGKLLYQHLMEIIRREHPHIKRIVIRQETNNHIALSLAKKMNFEVEAIFPEWSSRTVENKERITTRYVGSRFLALHLDNDCKKNSVTSVHSFQAQVPSMILSDIDYEYKNNVAIKMNPGQHTAICYYKNQIMGYCTIIQGVRTYSHIQFWSISPSKDCNHQALQLCLRELMCISSRQCKKIEIHFHDMETQSLLQALGFHYRGKRTASYHSNGTYYDELAADYSFFNIEDAKILIEKTDHIVVEKNKDIFVSILDDVNHDLRNSLEGKLIDEFTYLYLQNVAFQLIKSKISVDQFYTGMIPLKTIINNREIMPKLRALATAQ